jgi:hypothetical protein
VQIVAGDVSGRAAVTTPLSYSPEGNASAVLRRRARALLRATAAPLALTGRGAAPAAATSRETTRRSSTESRLPGGGISRAT